ncbi:MAG: hypothetical protein Q9213_002329 [Squamulea squamosa]
MGLLSSTVWEESTAAAVPASPEKSAPSAIETEITGGKVTQFTDKQANKAIADMTAEGWRPSNTNDDSTLRKRWSAWTNSGQIAQKSAKYAYINSGDWIASGTVNGLYSKACEQFLSKSPVGTTVDGLWTVYRAVTTDASGKSTNLNFRYFNFNSKNVKLTQNICDTVYKQLTSNLCQGKDNRGTDTQGGTIQIENDKFELGFDPDAA